MAGARGKPKGLPKSGGRQKGAVDKIKREAILAARGITPLDNMKEGGCRLKIQAGYRADKSAKAGRGTHPVSPKARDLRPRWPSRSCLRARPKKLAARLSSSPSPATP